MQPIGHSYRKKLLAVLISLMSGSSRALVLYIIDFSHFQTGSTGDSSLPASVGNFSKVSSLVKYSGKIPVLFISSEACPYCAAESWVLYYALSHFGTWSGAQFMYSNASDIFPNSPSLSFVNASFTSQDVSFYGYETSNRSWQPLQSLNSSDNELFTEYDPDGNIPFVFIGEMYLEIGSSYSPRLISNMTGQQVMNGIGSDTQTQISSTVNSQADYVIQILNLLGA